MAFGKRMYINRTRKLDEFKAWQCTISKFQLFDFPQQVVYFNSNCKTNIHSGRENIYVSSYFVGLSTVNIYSHAFYYTWHNIF